MLKFGDTVSVSRIYERRTRSRPSEDRYGDRRVKIWEVTDVSPRDAIFLGERTLINGTTEWYEDAGIQFTPDTGGHFRAALVCLSAHENPVYAPLDQWVTS